MEEEKIDSTAIDLLLSLQSKKRKFSNENIFQCKICSKQFQSFQALGGHSTSHSRRKIGFDELVGTKIKCRVHKCSVCGLEFSSGQSLGGHMKRHKKTISDSSSSSRFHFGPLDLKSSDHDVPRLLPLFF